MKKLTYLMDHILYPILIKKNDTVTDNPPIIIYINKIENRTTFNIKTGYYIELWVINKNEYGENFSHLEITEVELVLCNIVNSDNQHDSRVLYTFVPNKSFGQLLDISPKNVLSLKTFT